MKDLTLQRGLRALSRLAQNGAKHAEATGATVPAPTASGAMVSSASSGPSSPARVASDGPSQPSTPASPARLMVRGFPAGLVPGPMTRSLTPLPFVPGGGPGVGRTFASGPVEAAAVPPKEKHIIRAGGAESEGIETVASKLALGALYTSRGPTIADHGIKYKDHNEDAAVLGIHLRNEGRAEPAIYAGVFDQAGGMRTARGEIGKASATAAESFVVAAEEIAGGMDARRALRTAVERAHAKIALANIQKRTESITTFAGGVLLFDRASQKFRLHVVNVGDSKVLLFSSAGELIRETTSHNRGDEEARRTGDPNAGLDHAHLLTRSVGHPQEKLNPDIEHWVVSPTDVVVCVTDGVLDSNQAAQEFARYAGDPWEVSAGAVTVSEMGEIVKGRTSAAEIADLLSQYALRKMQLREGKPDNVSVVVLRVNAIGGLDAASGARDKQA